MRNSGAASPARHLLLVGCLAIAAVLGVACLDRPGPRPDRGTAQGATVVSFRTADGVTLNGRLWARDPRRVVIYLHEYRGNQTTWWPTAEEGAATDPSALTLDFRGHGASEGNREDVSKTPEDAEAALSFARARGYQRAVIVGAGMGAAAGIVAAADDPTTGLLGLSAPSAFAELEPVEVVHRLEQRIGLIATDGDLSAKQSIADFRLHAAIPSSRIVMLKGTDHGEGLLVGERRREATAAFRRLISELWQS